MLFWAISQKEWGTGTSNLVETLVVSVGVMV